MASNPSTNRPASTPPCTFTSYSPLSLGVTSATDPVIVERTSILWCWKSPEKNHMSLLPWCTMYSPPSPRWNEPYGSPPGLKILNKGDCVPFHNSSVDKKASCSRPPSVSTCIPGGVSLCSETRIWKRTAPPRDCSDRTPKEISCLVRHTAFWTTHMRRVPSGTSNNGQSCSGPPTELLGILAKLPSVDVSVSESLPDKAAELSVVGRLVGKRNLSSFVDVKGDQVQFQFLTARLTFLRYHTAPRTAKTLPTVMEITASQKPVPPVLLERPSPRNLVNTCKNNARAVSTLPEACTRSKAPISKSKLSWD
mmetsp:Transcript_72434/g.167796  ORF Transcript_72434/g.167796 Transcript_72434/m.167796 type:complete len:309 (-) Transcript_72434:117-1043(-)